MYQGSPIQVQSIWGRLGLVDLDVHFFAQVWEVFSQYYFKNIFCPFLSSSPSGISIVQILFLFIVSNELCKLSSPFFFFSFCFSHWKISNVMSSRSLIVYMVNSAVEVLC